MRRATCAPISLETLDLEDVREHEILVRLVATGICHTDLAMRDQAFPVPQPIVLGHSDLAGASADGISPLSKDNERIHGNFFGQSSFATYSICTDRNIVKVPNDAPLELPRPLVCGIQTGAAVINALKPRMGQSLAVFGSGSVGISALMAARAIGLTTTIAVDLSNERLELTRALGAAHVINLSVTQGMPM